MKINFLVGKYKQKSSELSRKIEFCSRKGLYGKAYKAKIEYKLINEFIKDLSELDLMTQTLHLHSDVKDQIRRERDKEILNEISRLMYDRGHLEILQTVKDWITGVQKS